MTHRGDKPRRSRDLSGDRRVAEELVKQVFGLRGNRREPGGKVGDTLFIVALVSRCTLTAKWALDGGSNRLIFTPCIRWPEKRRFANVLPRSLRLIAIAILAVLLLPYSADAALCGGRSGFDGRCSGGV